MTYTNPPQPVYGYQPPVTPPPTPPNRHILRTVLLSAGGAVLLLIVLAVALASGSKTPSSSATTPPPAAAVQQPAVSTPTTPAAPAATTQTASGSANQVITVSGLVPGASYVLSYTASGSDVNALIVDEGQNSNLVNDINDSGALSGSTLYTADAASITLQISNADGENWTLTFTPSSS